MNPLMYKVLISYLVFCIFFSDLNAQLMITQTYRSGNVDEIEIEIKNISGQPVTQNFYLVNFQGNTNKPKEGIVLGNFSVGQVKTFIQSGFNGKIIYAISTTADRDSYDNRLDEVGLLRGSVSWDVQDGIVKSLSRGTCAGNSPSITYNPSDWIFLDIAEVQNALPDQNIKNGIYASGASIWNGTVWVNGTPDRTRRVEINQPYTLITPIIACDLVVNASLNFDHNSSGTVEVYRNLTVNNNAVFTIGDKESLLTYKADASITGVISKKEKTTTLARIYDATYWSSPVQNAPLSAVFAGVNQSRVFTLRPEMVGPYSGIYKFWHPANGYMEIGRGYSVEGKTTGINEFSFTGKPNNGNLTKSIIFNAGTDPDGANNDANLIGNPYPSAINPDQFITTNTNIFDGAIYVWRHQQDVVGGQYQQADYLAYTLAGGQGSDIPSPYYIASGQGFMINATSTGNIQFNNSMRVKGNNSQFYKSEISKKEINNVIEKDRIWLMLSNEENINKEILIGFFDETTKDFDTGYDAPSWKGDGLQWYSLIGQERFAIQALSTFNEDKAVPLGLQVDKKQDLTIGISKSEGALRNTPMILVDHLMQTRHDLSLGRYKFSQDIPGEINDRFTIEFKAKALDTGSQQIEKNTLFVAQRSGEILLRSAEIISNVKIYDIQGRKLFEHSPNSNYYPLSTQKLKSGSAVFINVLMESGESRSRKLIIY